MKKYNIQKIIKDTKHKAELSSNVLAILVTGGLWFHQTFKIVRR